jgi:acylphosphatase
MVSNERVEILYKGYVQGVGFRFVARRIALENGVTGFVKNLPGGDVLTVGEGNKVQLEHFMNEMKTEMDRYIQKSVVDWQPATGEFGTFEIRF